MESIWIGYLRISNEKPEKHFKYLFTLVPELFLDFSLHMRELQESREALNTCREAARKKNFFRRFAKRRKIKKNVSDQDIIYSVVTLQ